ncbi:hypothetical protein NW762_012480 [Fusarium torreyae]|uniref:Acyl-CoA oxidase C-alpha1 domain-containing protein n=1 Tax=Fusarium torreyae TaxID=1237075 RepID=A0A9W8RR87_9HYPO|nr:hypothetical protein NW762_012480 [Fusarium torreyae]
MDRTPTDAGLPDTPEWTTQAYGDDEYASQKMRIAYARAKSLAKQVNMTMEDIMGPSQKFWDFHLDYMITADTAVSVILTIHWNLCMGTIAAYPDAHPTVKAILEELQQFRSVGEFMLTEVGHGLDARNIETTVVMNSDGSFDLHTPVSRAAKIMPPTTPHAGMSRLAVVFAQLIVDGVGRGVRPFIVRINEADGTMSPGVVSRLLPSRPGPKPVDHAVTTFHHVYLEPWALLGGISGSKNPRKDFSRHIQRVTIGTLSLSMANIPVLRLVAFIAGRYSQRRTVAGMSTTQRVPIITFSTQHTPVLVALASASVFEAFGRVLCRSFGSEDSRVWSGLACVYKQTVSSAAETLYNEMIDRCGWQGLYAHNQMIEMVMSIRGNSIAEGDKLVLCIRLLAQHEASLWKDASRLSKKIMITPGSNRNNAFNELILPRCTSLVKAIGHRMAYEAAESSDLVSPDALKLFEAECILQDPGWYVETKRLSTASMYKLHAEAVSVLLPQLDSMLTQTQASPWATSPILRKVDWEIFLSTLPAFSHDGNIPLVMDTDLDSLESDSTLPDDRHDCSPDTEQLIGEPLQKPKDGACHPSNTSQHNLVKPEKAKRWHWILRIGVPLKG